MLRVSVTDIDSYRYWRNQPEMTLDDLRTRLLQWSEPTDAMLVGRLLHSVLEHASDGDVFDRMGEDGPQLTVDCEVHIQTLPLRECKVEKVVSVPGFGDVMMVGKVDASDSRTVVDYKTTSRFDPETLVDTCQWRFYLWLLGAQRFVWEVFEIKDPLQHEPGVYRLTSHHTVEQWAYPSMWADCLIDLEDFCAAVYGSVPEYVAKKTMEVAA